MADEDTQTRLKDWIRNYVAAWNSNEAANIAALFTEQAAYYPEPDADGWHGRDAIVRAWIERRDEPGETRFSWNPVVVTRDVAVIHGHTSYPAESYSNLWIIRLAPDGRCAEFTEWWMQRTESDHYTKA